MVNHLSNILVRYCYRSTLADDLSHSHRRFSPVSEFPCEYRNRFNGFHSAFLTYFVKPKKDSQEPVKGFSFFLINT